MSLRLPAKLPPGAGLRAVLLSLARQAKRDVEHLSEAPEAHIHSLRTGMKKFRSVLRLAGKSVEKQLREALLERVRILKDAMAGSRDDAVVFKMVQRERLGLKCPHMGRETTAPDSLHGAAVELVVLSAALDLDRIDRKMLKRKWEQAIEKSRKAGRRAARSGDAHDFHMWRKRVKDLWYQGTALAGLIRKAKAARKSAQKLSDDLGLEHDLTVVLETVRGLARADRAALHAKRESLRAAALTA
jgi:hypothetical protein